MAAGFGGLVRFHSVTLSPPTSRAIPACKTREAEARLRVDLAAETPVRAGSGDGRQAFAIGPAAETRLRSGARDN